MAKGLRSKSKRANRTQLRKVLVEPIIRLRTEHLSKKLEDTLTSKNCDSLIALTKVFNRNNKNNDIMDEDDEDDNDDNDDVDDDNKKKEKSIQLKEKLKKIKGSKPKTARNQGKQLEWF